MRQAFGGYYRCLKNHSHQVSCYFFDSKPERILCPRCDDSTLAELTRILDVKGKSGRGRKKRIELPAKQPKFAA
jgi:hypothetical protein